MSNRHVEQRLLGIQSILNGVHQSGIGMSSASKGLERQAFIDNFLSEVLPPIYRFGTGDATDIHGNKSGQLDVVVEYPIAPSLPSTVGAPRLYLAESIAAVIEVKSNLANQWDEALHTAEQLAKVQRNFGVTVGFATPVGPTTNVPIFAVGYTGWANIKTIEKHLHPTHYIAGVLVIDQGLYVCKPEFGGFSSWGPGALWGLICSLHQVTTALHASSFSPLDYLK